MFLLRSTIYISRIYSLHDVVTKSVNYLQSMDSNSVEYNPLIVEDHILYILYNIYVPHNLGIYAICRFFYLFFFSAVKNLMKFDKLKVALRNLGILRLRSAVVGGGLLRLLHRAGRPLL